MASLRDVARVSGVSTATVSNVLNGRSERVGAETRDKVWAAVRDLKYRPTPLEKNQKAILSHNLGVMVPDLTEGPLLRHGYFRNILDGTLEAAALRAWSITIFVQRMWDDVGHAVRRSYDGRCDGLVMIAPQPGNEVVQTLHERGTPLVFIGSTPWLSNISSVDVDNLAIGSDAARYLIKLGHRRLAYVGHEYEQVSSVERREAFFREAARAGISEEGIAWIRTPSTEKEGEIAAMQLVESPQRPTGLLCWHDGLATQLVSELARLGLRIPQDFSVMSVNDSAEAQTCIPPLTTFRNPLHEIGKRAARLLIDQLIEGSDAIEHVRFPAELILRDSTGPAPSACPASL